MREISQTTKALLQALACAGLGVLAFAGLSTAGAGLEPSLIAGLVLAGLCNIGTLAALNDAAWLPTSPASAGELSP
jgi:hypothetical protein